MQDHINRPCGGGDRPAMIERYLMRGQDGKQCFELVHEMLETVLLITQFAHSHKWKSRMGTAIAGGGKDHGNGCRARFAA